MKDQFLTDFRGIANISNSLFEETSANFWIFDPVKESNEPCSIIISPTDDEKKGSMEIKNPNNKTIHFFQIDQGLIKKEYKRCDFVIFDDEKKIIFCELKMDSKSLSKHDIDSKTLHNAELQLFSTLIFFRQRTDLRDYKREFVIGMPKLSTRNPTVRQNYQNVFLELHNMKLTIGHSITL
jgi:hypothetical protein